jgi:DNA-binding phage protein
LKEKKPEKFMTEKVSFPLDGIATRIEALTVRANGKRNLAKMADLSESQLYRYINGDRDLKLGTALALCQAGGVTLDWLVYGGDNPDAQASGEFSAVAPLGGRDADIALSPAMLDSAGASGRDLATVTVHGDMMAPKIASGAQAVVNRADTAIRDGQVSALEIHGQTTVRRAQVTPDGISFSADNDRYQPFKWSVKEGESAVIGRVVWVLQAV